MDAPPAFCSLGRFDLRITSVPQSRGRRHRRRRRRDLQSSARLTWNTQAPALSARNEFSHKCGPEWASRIPTRWSSRISRPSTRPARFKTFAFLLSRKAMELRVIVAVQTRSILREIVIDGAERVKAQRLRKEIKLRLNQPVNEQQLEQARQKIIEVYQGRGFTTSAFNFEWIQLTRNAGQLARRLHCH